jgi:tmRNA-binding protein
LNFGIGKGKKLYDKRQDIAKKDAQKQIAINLKNKQY